MYLPFRRTSSTALELSRPDNPWTAWIEERWRDWLVVCLYNALEEKDIKLSTFPAAGDWLRALFLYASRPRRFQEEELRETLFSWFSGDPIDEEARKTMGLREAVPLELSPEDRNEFYQKHLLDLCELSRLGRPLVFCFDQVENYGKAQESAVEAFGWVVSTLVDRCTYQYSVIFSNLEDWERRICPRLDPGVQHRISPASRRFYLEGITLEGAYQLARSRMEQAGVDPQRAQRFFTQAKLESLFQDKNQIGARQFLFWCFEEWERQECGKVLIPKVSVESLWIGHQKELLANAEEKLRWDLDRLTWAVKEAAKAFGLTEEFYRSPKGYFTLRLLDEGLEVYVGFEPNSDGRRWTAIAREAQKLSKEQGRLGWERRLRFLFLRTPELPPLPKPSWASASEINQNLSLVRLNREELASLYALYNLRSEAAAGDLPYSLEEVTAFLKQQFQNLASGWLGRQEQKPAEPAGAEQKHTSASLRSDSTGGQREAPAAPASRPGEEFLSLSVRDVVAKALGHAPFGILEPTEEKFCAALLFHEFCADFSRFLCQSRHMQILATGEALARACLQRFSSRIEFSQAKNFLAPALEAFSYSLPKWLDPGKNPDWGEVFEAIEEPVAGTFGLCRVQGRVDALRRHPTDGRVLLEYKAVPSGTLEEHARLADALQLALYAEILGQMGRPIQKAQVEYYTPTLAVREFSREELKELFRRHVQPVLQETCQQAGASMTFVTAAGAPQDGEEDLQKIAQTIENTYKKFGVSVSCSGWCKAPQLFRFRLTPGEGVRVRTVESYLEDLRVALKLEERPLTETGPGFVALDIPRKNREVVRLEDFLHQARLPRPLGIPVGITPDGQHLCTELSSLPHLLVAGTTGSGKSVYLRCLVQTLCQTAHGLGLKLYLVDPKWVTFQSWQKDKGIPLLTGFEETQELLKELTQKMGSRYRRLAQEGFQSLWERIDRGTPDLAPIVLVFDEFGDFMLRGRQDRRQFEELLVGLARKGRAAGIHLVLATQHPTTEVVTAQLKSNLPARIAFRVAQRSQSQVILDEVGAEHLLGRGDLLCNLGPGQKLLRAQAPFL